MMISAIVAAILLILVLAAQVRWANEFVGLYRQHAHSPGDQEAFHVGVILALRGADPFLENSLRGLMRLSHPSHEIRIIVDSPTDPAAKIVERIRDELHATNVEIEFLKLCQETSSLKNSALIQGIKGCSEKCEAYAWLDSDTVPYPEWLTDLVAPLYRETTGASCGIRWYAPPTTTLANYVRHIWNSAAVLQMVAFKIGWGGAFAIRKAVYDEVGLERKWCRALVEDTLASNEVLLDGKLIEFVPQCTMPNPESASLGWCLSFVTRQLQGLKYYHNAWRTVLLYGLFSGALLVLNAALLVVGLCTGDLPLATVAGLSLATFGIVAGWLMQRSERCVNAFIGERAVGGYSLPWMLILAAPITQVIHLVALVRAYLLGDVTWRGIRYQIHSGLDIKRTNYAPYVQEADTVQHSL